MRKFLTIMLAAFGLLLLAGCKDSPKQVAKNWMQAIADGDVETANKYSTSKVHVINALAVAGVKEDPNAKKEITDSIAKIDNAREEINGDTAKLYENSSDTDPLTLKKVDGEWKVDMEK